MAYLKSNYKGADFTEPSVKSQGKEIIYFGIELFTAIFFLLLFEIAVS